jgi:membrane-associated phospholipid phosphatase
VPAWRVPLALAAAGCGLSRIWAGAHFASDVVGAWCVSYAVCCAVGALMEPPRRGAGA